MLPDLVWRVMCHVIAYCTREVPRRESVWLVKKRARSRFHV
jgi:hypothetical protein